MGICNSQHKPNTHTHQEDLSQQGTTSNTLELGEVKAQAEYGSSVKGDNSVTTAHIASGRSKADIYREMNSSRSVSVFILCFSCALSFPSIDRGQNLNSFLPPPGQRYKG